MRRTPYLLLIAALLAGVSLQSCTRNDDPEEQKKEQDPYDVNEWENEDINGNATMAPPMQFSVTSTGSLSDPEVTTRGASGTNGKNYAFNLYDLVTIKVDSKAPKVYKITNTTTGDLEYNGTPSTDGFYWESKDDINVTAWSYGSTTEMANDPKGQTFNLEENQKTNGYQELLYMAETPKSYGTDGSVALALQHMLSRLMITVNQDAASAKDITSITIGDGVNTLPTSATFTPSDPKKWTAIGTETGTIIPKTENSNTLYSAVLIPTTYSSGMKFIIITTGVDPNKETFAYTLPADVELLAGKQYNYTITVKNGALVVTGCTIADWGTGATGGTVTINTLP